MSRRPFVAGNWKMHKTASEAGPFVSELAGRVPAGADVAVCVPFTDLATSVEAAAGTALQVFAQNMHQLPQGAFTGEISAPMLLDLGVDGVLLGHSERRQYFGETDAALAEKLSAALDAGLDVILAVGESEGEREAGETESVLERQVTVGLAPAGDQVVTIAYEPVWAIGTGKTATPDLAQEAHELIKSLYDTRVLYGGSVKPDNIHELVLLPDVDGARVGGASLDVRAFSDIVARSRQSAV